MKTLTIMLNLVHKSFLTEFATQRDTGIRLNMAINTMQTVKTP